MRDLEIKLLRDEFGLYELHLKCKSCLHERRASPHILAKLCGWDARLVDVARRMRCSKCGERKCSAKVLPLTTPRGYHSH